MNKLLVSEEIPQGVIEDLNKHFNNIEFDLSSDIDNETKSMKSNYCDKSKNLENGVVMDLETFAPVMYEGYHGTSYLVRLNKTDKGCKIKQVIAMPLFHPVNLIGPLEQK